MIPCFDRISADWKAIEVEDWDLMNAKTYHLSPGECALDLVRELWCLAECPIPSLSLPSFNNYVAHKTALDLPSGHSCRAGRTRYFASHPSR